MKSFDGLDDTISALSLEATFQYGIVTDKHKKREVFYEITEADYPAAKSRVPIEILPQEEYVVINCKKEQEAATIDRLTAYLADKDQPFEKLYFFYFLDGTLDNEAIQIQVPIKKGLRETTLTV